MHQMAGAKWLIHCTFTGIGPDACKGMCTGFYSSSLVAIDMMSDIAAVPVPQGQGKSQAPCTASYMSYIHIQISWLDHLACIQNFESGVDPGADSGLKNV